MQEIHSIGGGDRRLRPHHQNQALKCPRCDSFNTKFCYYNNYNLSQPRHFCKNCRRYWTKGGVLRNVPVGGGCRKSKRSNKPNNMTTTSSSTVPGTTPQPQPPPEHKSNSHSGSESSTLTATEAISAPTSNPPSKNLLFENIREPKVFENPSLELEQGGGGVLGSFTNLVTSTSDALPFGFGNNNILDASSFRFGTNHHQGNDQVHVAPGGCPHGEGQWQQQKVIGMSGDHHRQEFEAVSLLDHTVPVEFSSLQNKTGHGGGFGSLDWNAGADQGLFDFPNTLDQPYWTHTHWSDQDNHSLFHLP